MELMTEEWHNKFGVFKNGFGNFEYILPFTRSFDITVVFTTDYVMLKQGRGNPLEQDLVSIWNKDLMKRDMSVNEWKDLYYLLTGETLTITLTI